MSKDDSASPVVLEIHSGITLKGQLSMAKDVILTGRFEGDLRTLGRLTVASGGTVLGTIEAGGLRLEPGNNVEAIVKVIDHTPKIGKAPLDLKSSSSSSGGGWLSLQKIKELAFGRK